MAVVSHFLKLTPCSHESDSQPRVSQPQHPCPEAPLVGPSQPSDLPTLGRAFERHTSYGSHGALLWAL